MEIPIVIPAYEPDERLIELANSLIKGGLYLVIVDDGSGSDYRGIFDRAEDIISKNGVLLRHDVNKGKGRALKTAFEYVLKNIPDATGVVTADSDGQHSTECIKKVKESLQTAPDSLILGVRTFNKDEMPWKSWMGNVITIQVMKLLSGRKISDTQTGLRGIPKSFMKELLEVPGERFEFETQMLLKAIGSCSIVEVPIKTIYDSKHAHKTHFNPLLDSVKIYRVLLGRFIRYTFSALSSFVIDIALFSVFCMFLKNHLPAMYAAVSTVAARIISATYNYAMNYKYVFKSRKNKTVSAGKYYSLAVVQMGCSAALVTLAIYIFSGANESILKIIVDTLLFFISYQIQKRFIF